MIVNLLPLVPHSPPYDLSWIFKSTLLFDFVYSTYSSSLASFITSIHNLYEYSPYEEAILDPLWQYQAIAEENSPYEEAFLDPLWQY